MTATPFERRLRRRHRGGRFGRGAKPPSESSYGDATLIE